jgi:hypothetical protein
MNHSLRAGSILVAIGISAAMLLNAGPSGSKEGPAVKFEDYPVIEPRGYVCYRAAKPLTIDGKLDEAAWEAAPWSEDFVDIEGDKKPKPRQRTRMKMLWDDQYLYIGALLDQEAQAAAANADEDALGRSVSLHWRSAR